MCGIVGYLGKKTYGTNNFDIKYTCGFEMYCNKVPFVKV